MSFKVKLLSLILAVLCLFSLNSCSPEESEEELLSIAKSLTEASVSVNEMVFGEGILALAEGYKVGAYTEADPASLQKFGVSTMADIRAKIAEVYASSTVLWIESTVFSSVKQDGQVITYTRYYDGTKMVGAEEIPVFMVKENYEPFMTGEVSYFGYKILKAKKNEVTFTVDIDNLYTRVFAK